MMEEKWQRWSQWGWACLLLLRNSHRSVFLPDCPSPNTMRGAVVSSASHLAMKSSSASKGIAEVLEYSYVRS